jgi:hypothetical protein
MFHFLVVVDALQTCIQWTRWQCQDMLGSGLSSPLPKISSRVARVNRNQSAIISQHLCHMWVSRLPFWSYSSLKCSLWRKLKVYTW